jgi:hypothetical protein
MLRNVALLRLPKSRLCKNLSCMNFYVKAILAADFLPAGRTQRRTPRTAGDDKGLVPG